MSYQKAYVNSSDITANYKACSWNELESSLQSVFPEDQFYTYVIEKYTESEQESFIGAPDYAFEVQVRVNISDEIEAKDWVSKMFSYSGCTYRHTRGVSNKVKGKRVIYKAYMHCQHQRKALTPKQEEKPKKCLRKQPLLEGLRNKKTSCPSKLKLVVTIPTKKAMCSRLKPLLVSHPTVITLLHSHNHHNHPIKSAHALSFRPVSKDTIDAYYQLFANGYSAASARHVYEAKLMIEHDGNIMEELADRAINPSTQDISRLYNKWREQHLGPENGKEMFEKLEEYIKEYNLRHKDEGGCIMLKRYSAEHIEPPTDDKEPVLPRKKKLKLQKQKKEESLTVAICTPLMARIHQGIPQAGELMYVDSTASIDRYNLSMFLLSTSHVGGGLPLGVMICSDESTSTIQECLLQYKGIIPKAAFYNQALAGPKVIMTDDSEAQRHASTYSSIA